MEKYKKEAVETATEKSVINTNGLTEKQLELINNLVSGMKVSYLELIRNGIKIVNDPNNRGNYSLRNKDFLNSIRKDGIQNPIQVITADDYISRNGELEIDGVKYLSGSDETSNMFIILDGGNRAAALNQIIADDPTFDKRCNVIYSDLAEGVSCFKGQDVLNNMCKPWSAQDRMNFLMKQYKPKTKTIMSFMYENSEKYGISLRSLYMMCTKDDGYKKEMLKKSMSGTELDTRLIGVKEEIESGEILLHAMLVAFRKEKSLLKNMAVVKAYCNDFNKEGERPDSKEEHRELLLTAVKSLDNETLKVAKEKSSVSEKTQVFAEYFNRFFNDCSSSVDALENHKKLALEAEEDFDKIKKEEKEKEDKKAKKQEEDSLNKLKTRCCGKFSTLSEQEIKGGKAEAINLFVEKHSDDVENFIDSLSKSETKKIFTTKKIAGVKKKEQYIEALESSYKKFISTKDVA